MSEDRESTRTAVDHVAQLARLTGKRGEFTYLKSVRNQPRVTQREAEENGKLLSAIKNALHNPRRSCVREIGMVSQFEATHTLPLVLHDDVQFKELGTAISSHKWRSAKW